MLEVALAGAPSCGKSTFFKAATLIDVKIAPYPFTTTTSTEGIAHVVVKCPCSEKNQQCKKCIDGKRPVPIKLWDIVGLVPGAHLGRGRGVAFLDDIRQAAALIHIIDVSGRTDLNGNPTENADPSAAVRMLEEEFAWWMVGIFKKAAKGEGKDFEDALAKRFSGLGITKQQIITALSGLQIDSGNWQRWSDEQIFRFCDLLRSISKPSLIAANKIDVQGAWQNYERLKEKFPNKLIIPTSGDYELALREAAKAGIIRYIPGSDHFEIIDESRISEAQKTALARIQTFLNQHSTTGVQQTLDAAVFQLLDMIVVYPVADPHRWTDKKGNLLPDAYLVKRGSTARELAFQIHQEIGQKFVAAIDARTGKQLAADYVLKDGDIISIKAGR